MLVEKNEKGSPGTPNSGSTSFLLGPTSTRDTGAVKYSPQDLVWHKSQPDYHAPFQYNKIGSLTHGLLKRTHTTKWMCKKRQKPSERYSPEKFTKPISQQLQLPEDALKENTLPDTKVTAAAHSHHYSCE